MRYGVLADVHGNLHALEAALATLARLDVGDYLCAGDLVGYGPQPNECVAAVAALGARCVAGNHDLIAIGRASDDDCSQLARDSLRWTRAQLDATARRYLEQLPAVVETPDGVVVAHGSLGDPSEYVRTPAQRVEQLGRLHRDHPWARVLMLGHTHLRTAHSALRGALEPCGAIALAEGDRLLLNPGSVGQSREPRVRARFVVLDLDRREVTFHAVRFDVRGCRRALRQRGLPTWSYQLRPSRARRCAGAVRRALRRVA